MSTIVEDTRKRREYDQAFKRDAVQRVILTGKSCATVADELGIKSNNLSRWRREYLEQTDQPSCGGLHMKPSELVEQLRVARLEIADLREQRDILKKALSIFSRLSRNGGPS